MKFWLEAYERMTDNLIFEKEFEFNNEEEAEAWAQSISTMTIMRVLRSYN